MDLVGRRTSEFSCIKKDFSFVEYGEEARALYNKVAWMTIVLWTLYPVVWIIAEGQRMVSASMEACLYAIMDVSAKCVFGIIIVQARGALEAINSNQTFRFFSNPKLKKSSAVKKIRLFLV